MYFMPGAIADLLTAPITYESLLERYLERWLDRLLYGTYWIEIGGSLQILFFLNLIEHIIGGYFLFYIQKAGQQRF